MNVSDHPLCLSYTFSHHYRKTVLPIRKRTKNVLKLRKKRNIVNVGTMMRSIRRARGKRKNCILKSKVFLSCSCFLTIVVICRKDKKDRVIDKDRERKPHRDEGEDESHERSKYNVNRNRKPGGTSQRPLPQGYWDPHSDRERWNSSQVSHDRYPIDHKRERFDYQKPMGFHRDHREHNMRAGENWYLCGHI